MIGDQIYATEFMYGELGGFHFFVIFLTKHVRVLGFFRIYGVRI